VSLCMPFIDERILTLWFSMPNMFFLAPVPIITFCAFVLLWKDLHSEREIRPFLLTIFIFLLGYVGLGISLFPWIVPFSFTLWDAAAASTSQSFLLVGTAVFLPIILVYTGYSYYIFRGKADDKAMY
jgi:cytochrome bd ubiquinol oxidase subunit II